MADEQAVAALSRGVGEWNVWRASDFGDAQARMTLRWHYKPPSRSAHPDLSDADLSGLNLVKWNLNDCDLSGAKLIGANLSHAAMQRTKLRGANLTGAILDTTDLRMADLQSAILVDTNIDGARLTGCRIYGASVWRLRGAPADQSDLVITPDDEARVTVGDLAVAQFVYLLLTNPTIRQVIDSITSKAVLVLGRFTEERKSVLDAIKDKLRRLNYVPIVFDFEKPKHRDFSETIMTLAGMCLFIIADITNPKSSPLELQATVPNYMVPFVPILCESEAPFAMFVDLQHKFDWVLDVRTYDTEANLINHFERAIVAPALNKHRELLVRKADKLRTVTIKSL